MVIPIIVITDSVPGKIDKAKHGRSLNVRILLYESWPDLAELGDNCELCLSNHNNTLISSRLFAKIKCVVDMVYLQGFSVSA
jgi:hypothetical protein